jgi:hypothetical protein
LAGATGHGVDPADLTAIGILGQVFRATDSLRCCTSVWFISHAIRLYGKRCARKAKEQPLFDTTTPITPAIGIEITGAAGDTLASPDVAAWCRKALDDHGVLLFRECHIGDDALVSLSCLLGEVVIAPVGGQKGHPEISAISLDPAKTVLASYNSGTFHWHIDGATDAVPQKATLLTALEVSAEGGVRDFGIS